MFLIPPTSKTQTSVTSAPSPATDDHHDSSRVKKACNRCRVKKIKCDGKYPCGRCSHDRVPCQLGRKDRGDVKELSRGYIRALETQQAYLIDALRALSERGPEDSGVRNLIARLQASGLDVGSILDTKNRSGEVKNEQGTMTSSGIDTIGRTQPTAPEAPGAAVPNQLGLGNGLVTTQDPNTLNTFTNFNTSPSTFQQPSNNDMIMPALDDPAFADQWWESWLNVSQAIDAAPTNDGSIQTNSSPDCLP